MPYLALYTNSELPPTQKESLSQQLSQSISTMLGKSEKFVMVHILDHQTITFAGSDLPCAYLELKSISLPEEQCSSFANTLCSEIATSLGIAQDRIYIEFSNAQRHLWGWNGSTF
ncbi:MAG: hypothetical protein HQL48_10115 [Gammaproteobacteria bacterium]|nr:hypothetical protein [Gammaproteobacteria bacterium]